MKKRIKEIIKEVKELERELKEDEELKDFWQLEWVCGLQY